MTANHAYRTTMKLCVIGIDALDPELVTRWIDHLPTFRRLLEEGRWGALESTFPPDSIPAWTTIYTGLDPSEHGGLEYINYLDVKSGAARLDNSRVRGKSFWDRVAATGRRVLVLNPFMAYPAWETNGVMVAGPVFVDGNVSCSPAEARLPDHLPELGGMVDFPTARTLDEFYERCVRVTAEQGQFFRYMVTNHSWDLAYVLFLTLDRVKHFYWRFEDAEDPYHSSWLKRPHPVRDFYVLVDRELGDLLRSLPRDSAFFIVSDHGHQRRCTRLLYVNELLRRAGMLAAPTGLASVVGVRALVERAKNAALDWACRWALEDKVTTLSRWVPKRKALKRGDHVIRNDRSLARASSFAGVNPFGGIVINEAEVKRRGLDQREVIEELTTLLGSVYDETRGQKVVRWAKPRDEAVPPGGRVEAYPDILFELYPEYGVSWSIFRPLIGPNVTHRKISGGHTRFGILIGGGALDSQVRVEGRSVADIYGLVLQHFGIH